MGLEVKVLVAGGVGVLVEVPFYIWAQIQVRVKVGVRLGFNLGFDLWLQRACG